ncbi:MAG: DNA adenine methylase [Treponema sp.]|jgi:DNA adenine methylase|nr:DNA adenine methylase [Treponema sp.]
MTAAKVPPPKTRPFLKWAGGKRQLLEKLRGFFPADRTGYTYYEPFIGGGAAFFDLQPDRAVINDCIGDLAAVYRVIRQGINELLELLEQYRTRHSRDYYYYIRNQDRDKDRYAKMKDAERAARFLYLNRTCYNGLYRVNRRGEFNVPCGRYQTAPVYDEANLRAIHRYLASSGICILNGDFADAVKTASGKDFVYFDPPYHSPDRSGFTGYRSPGFGEGEQRRLRDTFAELSRRGVSCLLSNADTPFIRELYRDFGITGLEARRAINSDAVGRGTVREVLVSNFAR